MKRFLFLISCLFIYTSNLFADIKLPAIISDNMVLQQEIKTPIWGWADPGEKISLQPNWPDAKAVQVTADSNGNWKVDLKTPQAGGPYQLQIKGKNTLTVKNILVGEVWVGSGQSNMEMPVAGWPNQPVKNSDEEIKNATNPQMRLFTVEKNTAINPQKDVKGKWVTATPETVATFSATAYFFGKDLYNSLKEPIGLIHTSWGGTVAEAWTSEKALRELGDFDKELNIIDSIKPNIDATKAEDSANQQKWEEAVANPSERYAQATFDDSRWKTMPLPQLWEDAGYPDLDGIVWYRTTVNVPKNWEGKTLTLDLGPIDDIDITWFNGEKIGETKKEGLYWAAERTYTIPGELVKAGKNEISIRVVDFGGNGGVYGKKEQLKIYPENGDPKEDVSLAKDWKFYNERKAAVLKLSENPNRPAALYNAMLAPIMPYGIKGVIWYQGESNVGRAAQYERLFPLMIKSWRKEWSEGDFPFYFVQIAPFGYAGDGTASAALRNAQRKSVQVKNTGMAVLLDIGSLETIHPPNKEEVGRRLSLLALDKTYGENVVSSGPTVDKMKVKGNKIILYFKNTGGGLKAQDPLNAFEIAGADGNFVQAKAIVKADQIILTSDEVQQPVSARYAWKDKAQGALFNQAGLPASSFEISK